MDNGIDDMKKTIALIMPPMLPVPAVKGGAVETLVTLLLNENEKHRRVYFHVFSIYDSRAFESAAYKNSEMHYIHYCPGRFTNYIVPLKRSLQKVFGLNIFSSRYYSDVFVECEKLRCDYFVGEVCGHSEFGRFARTFGRERLFFHIHNHFEYNFFFADILNNFGNTISVSRFIKNAWEGSCKAHNTKMHQNNYVVVNAVDEELFTRECSPEEIKEVRASFGASERDIVVMYIGRIARVKGVIELIDAVLRIDRSDVKLVIIGGANFADNVTSEYHQYVLRLISENPETIKGCGYVDNSEIYKYAKCADIRVLPSKWEEAGSLALVEGIHASVPLIITNSGGMPEVVNNEGAMIIEKGETLTDNLVSAMKYLIEHPEKRNIMKEANIKQSRLFRKEKFYNDFVNVIH